MINCVPLKKLRLLIIDDNRLLCRSLSSYFTGKVKLFKSVNSAEEALSVLQEEVFDVIVCDYRLAGMNGLKFFEVLEGSEIIAKKILISAFMDESIRKRAFVVGVHHTLPKPFNIHEIVSLVTEC